MVKKAKDTTGINVKPIMLGVYKYIKEDWSTVAFVIPRSALKSNIVEKELLYNSIYFLVGKVGITEKVYVGQGKKRNDGTAVLTRLREHHSSTTEWYRDIWEYVVVVTNANDKWGPSTLNVLENMLYKEIPANKNLNGNTPNCGGVDEEIDYVEKIRQIKALVTAIGVNVFNEDSNNDNEYKNIEIRADLTVEDLQMGMSRIPEIVTPHKVVKEMVDKLPESVWNLTTKFLDMACKGGEYLREIYERLMQTEIHKTVYPNEIERAIYILNNQIYGIALSEVSLDRTVKKLNGYSNNIRRIRDYIKIIRGTKRELVTSSNGTQRIKELQDYLEEEFGGRDMRFDVVIGNPPYQENTGSGLNESGGKSIFGFFIEKAIQLNSQYVCMITPTKWIAGNQKDMQRVRNVLTSNNNLVHMVDYMDAKECFLGASIAGGVSYFLYDKKYNDKCKYTTLLGGKKYTHERKMSEFEIIPRHSLADSIIKKIIAEGVESIENHTYKNLWDLGTDYVGESDIPTDTYNIEVKTPRGSTYTSIDNIIQANIKTYKVVFTRVACEHALEPTKSGDYKLFSSLDILKPGQICNASYMIVGDIIRYEHAVNIMEYLKTKFVRFLVLQTMFGIGFTVDRFRYVPMQDFTQLWTDQMLYEKYKLTNEEINFIENIIKSM